MQTTTISPFGVDVTKSISSDAAEYDSLAKKVGACHEAACDYYNYHRYFSEVRDIVLHGQAAYKDKDGKEIPEIKGMDDVFGIERTSEVVLGKDGKPKLMQDGKTPVTTWTEKEGDFFKRVVATKKITDADIKVFIQSIVDQIPWDPSVAERTARGPGKLANVWLEAGREYYKGMIADPATLAEWNKRVSKVTEKTFEPATAGEGVTPEAHAEKESERVGRLLKEFSEAIAKQQLMKLPGATSAMVK